MPKLLPTPALALVLATPLTVLASAPLVAASAPARSAEALWHLRAGLNVAALQCRGHQGALTGYRTLLARHRTSLDAAYRAEQASYRGAAAFDRHMTLVYNRFAYQSTPVRFCTTAAAIGERTARMAPAELSAAAPALLSELENSQRG